MRLNGCSSMSSHRDIQTYNLQSNHFKMITNTKEYRSGLGAATSFQ